MIARRVKAQNFASHVVLDGKTSLCGVHGVWSRVAARAPTCPICGERARAIGAVALPSPPRMPRMPVMRGAIVRGHLVLVGTFRARPIETMAVHYDGPEAA